MRWLPHNRQELFLRNGMLSLRAFNTERPGRNHRKDTGETRGLFKLPAPRQALSPGQLYSVLLPFPPIPPSQLPVYYPRWPSPRLGKGPPATTMYTAPGSHLLPGHHFPAQPSPPSTAQHPGRRVQRTAGTRGSQPGGSHGSESPYGWTKGG